jgi:hypothetical protein
VTGHLTYDANVARLENLHGRAERRRMARRAARTSIPAATQTRVGVADPFRPTAELVELLSLRAARLRGGSDRRRSAQRRVRIELQRVATVVRRG